MRLKLFLLALLAAVFLIQVPAVRAEAVGNGAFNTDLGEWYVEGNVIWQDGAALLGEDDGTFAGLYQEIQLSPGYYLFQFDYAIRSIGGAIGCDGADPNCFTLPDLFAGILLYDSDQGPSSIDIQFSGSVTAQSGHFTSLFRNSGEFVMPWFILYNDNFAVHDSSVFIDNVSITEVSAIPEPGTLVSLAIGLIGLAIAGKRKLSVIHK